MPDETPADEVDHSPEARDKAIWDAQRYGEGRADSVAEKIAEEDGRYSDFIAAQGYMPDETYYVEGLDEYDTRLVHKGTHEMFGVDVTVNIWPIGQKWFAADDQSPEAQAERQRQADRVEAAKRQTQRSMNRFREDNADAPKVNPGYL